MSLTALLHVWNRHLSDERLFDCYLRERTVEGMDPRAADHLGDCEDCSQRFRDVAALMDDVRATADDETAAVFTPDVLLAQQQAIARRIDLVGNSPRVLSFPAHTEPARAQEFDRSRGSRVAAGWVAAAAAAGLFVGVGAGVMYDARLRPAAPAVVTAPSATAPSQVSAPEPEPVAPTFTEAADEELEATFDRPRTPELMALDIVTPHAQPRTVDFRR